MPGGGVWRLSIHSAEQNRGENRKKKRPVTGSLSPNGNFSFQRDERAASRPRNAKIVTFSRAAA